MKVQSSEYRIDGTARLGIEFASRRDAAAVECAVGGACWVRGDGNGGVVRHEQYPAPAAEPDPMVAPHFPPPSGQMVFVPSDSTPEQYPGGGQPVYAQHLCGYEYTPENYRRAAAWMESAGFACLRSRRGEDGKFWEVWYLPGPWLARGPVEGVKTSHEIAKQVAIHARPGAVTIGAPGGWFQVID